MTRRTVLLAALTFCIGAAPAWHGPVADGSARTAVLAPATYEIDRAHSQVSFKIKHLGISTVTGRFKDFSGSIVFDPQNPGASRATAAIRAASIDTDNERRDNHLRSADFFEVERYPDIAFAGNRLRRAAGGKYQLDGTLSMHGVTRPITLVVEHVGSARGPDGKARVAFNATGTLDRTAYGLTWNKAVEGGMLVGTDVQIQLELEAVQKD
ncbi:MAG: YceI family protein [Gemmatimonadetes bacterium]|nr:YceI family protein [Gemmatimonadota bacterium]